MSMYTRKQLEQFERQSHWTHSMARSLAACGLPVEPTCFPVGPSECRGHGPCDAAGKRPRRSGYKETGRSQQTPDEAAALVTQHYPCNIAIVTGPTLVIFEADSPEADEELLTLGGPALLATPTRLGRPGRGRGYLLRCQAPLGNAAKLGFSGAIDRRGDGGIFIAPGSMHSTGYWYSWAPGRAPWEHQLADVPSSLLALRSSPKQTTSMSFSDNELHELASQVTPYLSPSVNRVRASYRKVAQLWAGEGKRRGDTSASGLDFSLARELIQRGVNPLEVACALAARTDSASADGTYCARTALAAVRGAR